MIRKIIIRGPVRWSFSVGIGNLVTGVFIVMALDAQQFPITAVGGIVVMVMVLMVHGQLLEAFAVELTGTMAADPGEELEGALPIRFFTIPLAAVGL